MKRFKTNIPMVECEQCGRGWSLKEDDLKNDNLILKCIQCGNEFDLPTGITNALISENTFSLYDFISNSWFIATMKFKVGYAEYVQFPKKLKNVFKVFVTPSAPCYTEATKVTTDGFLLMSSRDAKSEDCKFGEEVTASVHVYGRHDDYNETWRQFLAYSREHYITGNYVASIVLSEIAFESYIDTALTEGYIKNGLDQDSISRFLVATEIPVKVNPLMNNLFKIKLSQSSVWNDWEKKILRWRNEIAHGRKSTATKEEAQLAFSTVIKSILYFSNSVLKIVGEEE